MLPWYQSDFCLHRGREIKTDSARVQMFLFVPLSSVNACKGFLLLLCSVFGTTVCQNIGYKVMPLVQRKKNSQRSSLFLQIYIIKQCGQARKQGLMVKIGGVVSELETLGG